VQVKACREYPEATLCSAEWSAEFALGVPVRNSTPGALDFDSTLFEPAWRWTSIPEGAGYDAVAYRCDSGNNDAGWLPMEALGECDPGLLANSLRVRVTANGQNFVRSYSPLNY